MSSASSPVPKDHPLMVAWRAYLSTEDFANTRRWVDEGDESAVDGSLWAVFEHGWRAAGGLPPFPAAPPAPVADLTQPEGLLDRWDLSDGRMPSVAQFNHAVDVANALHGKVARLTAELDRLRKLAEEGLTLAKVATNTWACVARSKRDHDVIAGLHRDIDAKRAALADTEGAR